MKWLFENYSEIVGILGTVHLLALAIVNLTPTPADDRAYKKFYTLVEKLAGLIGPLAKR